jgi:hypothetical protein
MYVSSRAVWTLGSQVWDPFQGTVVSEFVSVGSFMVVRRFKTGKSPVWEFNFALE